MTGTELETLLGQLPENILHPFYDWVIDDCIKPVLYMQLQSLEFTQYIESIENSSDKTEFLTSIEKALFELTDFLEEKYWARDIKDISTTETSFDYQLVLRCCYSLYHLFNFVYTVENVRDFDPIMLTNISRALGYRDVGQVVSLLLPKLREVCTKQGINID